MTRRLPAILCALLLVACGSNPPLRPRFFHGVSYTAFEHDGNEKFGLDPDRRKTVDANSDLVVEFGTSQDGTTAAATKEWQELNALLQVVAATTQERERLQRLDVDVSDAAQVQQIQAALRAHDEVATRLEERFEAVLGDRFEDVVSGRFDGRPGTDPYANFARYVSREIERLATTIESFTATRRKLAVSVEAFLLPRDGEARQLHVENYDSIPEGKYAPIDRYSLDLTAAEQKDLAMRLQQAELAASAVREIMDSKGKLDARLEQFVRNLKDAAQRFVDGLPRSPAAWRDALRAAEDALRQSATAPASAAVAAELTGLADDFAQLRQDASAIEDLVATIQKLPDGIQSLATALHLAQDLQQRVGGVLARVRAWKDRGASVVAKLGTIRQRAPELALAALVPEPVEAFVRALQSDVFPKSWELVVELVEMVRRSRATRAAIEDLAGKDQRLVFRSLDDLQPARIELPRAGLVLGDRVQSRVTFHRLDDAGNRSDVAHTERFDTEAQLIGLHRRLSAQLILVRAERGTGEATEWRPNAAVGAEYHYRIRHPEGLGHAWNFLDLGLGLHAASLDQGDENVELGIGAQVSVFGGLLTGGYGWNLSVPEDRAYFFLGIDLFDLLLRGSKVQVGAR